MRPFTLEHKIKVLVADIDGCLVPVGHAPFALKHVAKITKLNQGSEQDDSLPGLTILSGRPHPYVDALMQVFDIQYPAIFENGAGMAFRSPYRAEFRPGTEQGIEELRRLETLLVNEPNMILQIGKVASLSVFAYPQDHDIGLVEAKLRELINRHRFNLHIDPAHDCINILIPGIHKEFGLHWLAKVTGIRCDEIAGIGDSVGDIAWLERCALSCAPANADPRVKGAVDVVRDENDIEATLEFYQLIAQENRSLVEKSRDNPEVTL